MRLTVHHLDETNESIYGFLNAGWNAGKDNSAERNKMKRLLHSAIDNGLTDLQKKCLIAYYGGKEQKVIAEEMGLAPSTVSRHIKAAIKRLRNIAQYYS